MNNNISEYIQVFPKRIFFDIVSEGCGSGCVYCFTKHPHKAQSLLSDKMINSICNKIMELPDCSETIISLCPNTEPMKTQKSRELVKLIITRLASKVKFIQIATKEEIPISFLTFLNDIAQRKGQIRISISLPYLCDTDYIEPNAASIENRLKNFENIKGFANLISVLYLRPFNKQMIQFKEKYVAIVKRYNITEICLGAEFVQKTNGEQFCTYMYDKRLAPHIFENLDKESLFEFAEYIKEMANCRIFYSSICNIANCSDYGCMLKLYNYDFRYCENCNLRRISFYNTHIKSEYEK